MDSLVSTEDLDQASLLIRFRSFAFLFFFALLIAIAVACSLFIKVPIKVSGPAVIWSDVGVLQVTAEHPGTITSIEVKVGDRIEYNQKIATLDQKLIEDKLFSTQEKLNALLKQVGSNSLEEVIVNLQKSEEDMYHKYHEIQERK